MFLLTAICRPVKGLVVPRSSETVVDLAGAAGAVLAAGAAGAAAALAAGAAATGAGAAGALPAARSTSEAVILPLGPVPPMRDRSTFRSLASCLAYGVAMTRPSARGAGAAATGAGAGAAGAGVGAGAAGAGAGAAAAGAGAGGGGAAAAGAAAAGAAPPRAAAFFLASSTSASVSATKAIGAPTLALSPSLTTTAARIPSLKDSTSMSALSDSTTTMGSPFLTWSPVCFNQETILPSVMVDDRAGMKTSLTAFCTFSLRRELDTRPTGLAEKARWATPREATCCS
mmetsp:Transcript_15107/g.32745  ORF Transcript_15107/g.32745 Transcript_15107/m.32745 type:complete len:286 (-) Transcript_15107:106-963(-)